mgnify:CR=1 FL=1
MNCFMPSDFEYADDDLETMEKLLLRRGFLVERRGEGAVQGLFLSDNSFRPANLHERKDLGPRAEDDAAFLERLGEPLRLKISRDDEAMMRITWQGAVDSRFADRLFSPLEFQRESERPYQDSRVRFCNEEYLRGYKYPLSMLDTGTAALVKAFSSVGANTWESCDGHGGRDAIITFCGPFYARWAGAALRIALKGEDSRIGWSFSGERLDMRSADGSHGSEYYSAIYDAAVRLYAGRERLLSLKRQLMSDISAEHDDESALRRIDELAAQPGA